MKKAKIYTVWVHGFDKDANGESCRHQNIDRFEFEYTGSGSASVAMVRQQVLARSMDAVRRSGCECFSVDFTCNGRINSIRSFTLFD